MSVGKARRTTTTGAASAILRSMFEKTGVSVGEERAILFVARLDAAQDASCERAGSLEGVRDEVIVRATSSTPYARWEAAPRCSGRP